MTTTPEHLTTQVLARREAKLWNEDPGNRPTGLIAIAGAYPRNSWGGHEQGWTVYLVTPR